jgi:uncharacterized protein YceK
MRLYNCLTALCAAAIASAAQAASFKNLHVFTGGADGAAPDAPLIAGPDGTLYGTTSAGGGGPCINALDVPGCGTVFALTPPANGGTDWTETILYSFINTADGYSPVAGLVSDSAGNLYGTTEVGGNGTGPDCGVDACGTVFRLTPPAKGQTVWTKTTIYEFQDGADGAQPAARLVMDPTGALLGTTILGGPDANCSCGTVFRLTAPKGGTVGRTGAWTETTLHAFERLKDGTNPENALLAGPNGSYFGVTSLGGGDDFDCLSVGCGTVFALLPPAGGQHSWHEHVIHRFRRNRDGAFPLGDLIADSAGDLFGTTSSGGGAPINGGTVFMLSPPQNGATQWSETVLHAFGFGHDANVPEAGVIFGQGGALLGTTFQGGTAHSLGAIFSLVPPSGRTGGWTERMLYNFPDTRAGGQPVAALLSGPHHIYYGTSSDNTAFSLR